MVDPNSPLLMSYNMDGHKEFASWRIRLRTNNYFDTVKDSNVIGYIKGEVEPDRYVLLSNHR